MNPRAAFIAACEQEIAALKPGNVHVHAPGHRMTADDFRRSARAAAEPLCAEGTPLGRRVLDAVAATHAAIGQNTNLGIVLLSTPLIMAAEQGAYSRAGVIAVLDAATVQDTADVFEAIRLASPAGLGDAPRHDVRGAATAPLRPVMQEAAGRDRIAAQYANGFQEVFGLGLDAYSSALGRWGDPLWATTCAYLRFLASAPDSHILRKFGAAVAEQVRAEAAKAEAALLGTGDPADQTQALLNWDTELKRRRINPGTSADLTVATVLVELCGTTCPGPGTMID